VDELEALRKENAEQRRQLAQLIEQIARPNERVTELLAIAQRKQRKTSTAVAALPPAAPPVVEGEEQLAFEQRPKVAR
jgi:cell shape-determining protein MreC